MNDRFNVEQFTHESGLTFWKITENGVNLCTCATEEACKRTIYLLLYAEKMGGA
jgi:hypothetical protein